MAVTIEEGRLTIIFGLDEDGDSAITLDMTEIGPMRALGALEVAHTRLLNTMVAELRPLSDDEDDEPKDG